MLPQITGLALSLGQIFSGALITEIVFWYPGLGSLLYNAIINGDYNLIMGITIFSIVGITTAMLIVDLTYPLFDPRMRYQLRRAARESTSEILFRDYRFACQLHRSCGHR